MATALERDIRELALKRSLESFEGVIGVSTVTIVNRAAEFEKFLNDGKKDE